jgi:hypothetical protein
MFYAKYAGIEFKKNRCPGHCPVIIGAYYHAAIILTTEVLITDIPEATPAAGGMSDMGSMGGMM